MRSKERLDQYLLDKNPSLSRSFIQSSIMQGRVKIDGMVCSKPGTMVSDKSVVVFDQPFQKYVSRGGFKLEKALSHFEFSVEGLIALDAGISTGGFSDCLLQHGAKRVYGIDVGCGQVHEKILGDPRLIVVEKTNLRTMTELPEEVDLITLDLSFISVLKVLDAVNRFLKSDGFVIVLIKPQFEAEKSDVKRGGVVRSSQVHEDVIEKIADMLLNSPKAKEMPGELVKKIGYYWMQGQLTTDAGMEMLLKVAASIEPENTYTLLNESGFSEAAKMFKEYINESK